MLIVMECVGSHLTEVTSNATNGQIHLCQFVGGVGIFLSIDRDVTLVTVMCLDELHALYEHTSRTTTRVVNLTTIRLYHLCYQVDDGLRRIVLTFTLTFGNGKLTEEVFIDTADEIVLWVFQPVNLVDFIKQSSELGTVERKPRIVIAWQGTIQRRIALLHFRQCFVNLDSNIILLSVLNQKIPTALGFQIKDVLGIIKKAYRSKWVLKSL